MPRPFTDITYAVSGQPVKNGTIVVNATKGGIFEYEKIGAQNTNSGDNGTGVYGYHNNIYSNPTIATLATKYGNRFYNGLFVKSIPSGTTAGTNF